MATSTAHPNHSLISSEDVEGTEVYGSGDKHVGEVDHLMIDKVSGRVAYAVLLKSYGEGRGHGIDQAEAKIIYYYGVRSVPAPISLVREELDEHFEYPVVEAVEQVNTYFRDRLHELLERPTAREQLLQ